MSELIILNCPLNVNAAQCGGLALLGILVTVGIVGEQCEGLRIPIVDHPPPINAGWLAEVVLKDGAFAALFCAAERRHN